MVLCLRVFLLRELRSPARGVTCPGPRRVEKRRAHFDCHFALELSPLKLESCGNCLLLAELSRFAVSHRISGAKAVLPTCMC